MIQIFLAGRTGRDGRTNQPKVVQEVLADLKNVIQDLNPTESRKCNFPSILCKINCSMQACLPYICSPYKYSPYIAHHIYIHLIYAHLIHAHHICMLTLYKRYILLIPRLTKEHCTNPKNQTLARFNPSIKRGGG